MKASFKFGRIAGIEIGVHYTWVLAFALITWSLAEGLFPLVVKGQTTATYWMMGSCTRYNDMDILPRNNMGGQFSKRQVTDTAPCSAIDRPTII